MLITFWLLCAVFSGVLARSRKRSGAGWFCIGILCGPFGLLAAAMPPLETVERISLPEAAGPLDDSERAMLERLQRLGPDLLTRRQLAERRALQARANLH